MSRLGILTGLAEEVAALTRAVPSDPTGRVLIACSGANADRAERSAEKLIAGGAAALLSFGFAGGLDPAMAPGVVLLASAVRTADGTDYGADPGWAARLRAALETGSNAPPPMLLAHIAEAASVVAHPDEKARLFAASGAAAIDMESGPAARVAARAGIPFLALRVVLDSAAHRLPRAATQAIRPDGRVDPRATLGAALASPSDWPALVRLAHAHGRAAQSLRALAALAAADPPFAAPVR